LCSALRIADLIAFVLLDENLMMGLHIQDLHSLIQAEEMVDQVSHKALESDKPLH
jgi:hypothetical protein